MTVRLLGLSGSLRQRSFNTALLRAAAELLPEGASLELFDYREVPLYDGDLPARPLAVQQLVDAIAAADGLLVATPEYNHSVPGVLKNALDWASRPAYASCLLGKPTGVVSAAPGLLGGVRAQAHLKTILLGMGTPVFPGREVVVAQAGQRFDPELRLVDPDTRAFFQGWLAELVQWVGASTIAAD